MGTANTRTKHPGADIQEFLKGGGGTVNKVGVDTQKGVGAGGGYAPSRAKRGSF